MEIISLIPKIKHHVKALNCKVCASCVRKECGECKICQNKAMFGSQKRKKRCLKRKCENPIQPNGNNSQVILKQVRRQVSCGVCDQCKTSDCMVCIFCKDKKSPLADQKVALKGGLIHCYALMATTIIATGTTTTDATTTTNISK